MTEVVEYSLVVMVSTLFVAGSVMTYDHFSSFESGLQFRADFAAVSGLVSKAVEQGSASATISLPDSTFRCQGGSLTMTSGSSTDSLSVHDGCDFLLEVKGGAHVVDFIVRSSQLVLKVN
jgi:hypothetical protein